MSRDGGIDIDQESMAALQKRNSSELDALARHVRDLENAARQWNEDLRRQVEQIQSQPASNGAVTGGGEEIQKRVVRLENHLGKIKGDSRIDALLLRIGEVERKVGEGTPDPLLNEIAHRLASLERDSTVGGAPSPEMLQKIAELEQRVGQAGGQDPRTDDLILRMASFESLLKHPERNEAIADLQRKLADLEARPSADGAGDLQPEIESLRDRLAQLEARGTEPAEDLGAAVQEQIDKLRAELQEATPADDGAAARLAELEAQLMPKEAISGIEERLGERIAALADQINPLEGDQRLAQLGEQIDAVRTEIRTAQPSRETEALLGRLEAVERQLADTPAPEWVDQLETRLTTIEERTGSTVESARVDAVAAQIEELRASTNELRDARVDGLLERIGTLEQAESPENDVTAAELTALRGDVEELRARAADARDGRVDGLAGRLAAVEAGGNNEDLDALRAQVDDLRGALIGDDRIEALLARLEGLEKQVADSAPPEEFESINERISRMEMRVAEAASGGQVQDLTQRIFAIEEKKEPVEDPRVEGVVERLDSVEEKLAEGAVDKRMARGFVELANRLKTVEEQQAGSVSADRIDELTAQVAEAKSASQQGGPGEELEERLAALELRLAEKGSVDAEAELSGRLDHLETELGARDATAALAQASTRIEALAARVEELGAAGAEDGRVPELLEKVEALSAAASSDDPQVIAELKDRLDAVEARPAAEADSAAQDAALQGVRDRLAALEEAPREAGESVDLGPIEARIAELEAQRPSTDGEAAPVDLTPVQERIDALEAQSSRVNPQMWESMLEGVRDRLAALEAGGGAEAEGGGFDSSLLSALQNRIEAVEGTAAAPSVAPAELGELRTRLEQVEARPAAPELSAADGPLRGISERLERLEVQGASGGASGDLLARISELENRVVQMGNGSGGDGGEALAQERARWSKSFDQLVDHVRAIEDRLDGGMGGDGAAVGGNMPEVLSTLADRMAASMDRTTQFEQELRGTQSRMWYLAGAAGFLLFLIVFFLLFTQFLP